MTARARTVPLYVILIVSLAVASAVDANEITNGGFETGDFVGWTLSGNTGGTGIDHGTSGFGPGPHAGQFAAFFGPVESLGFLSQNIATIPSASYNLTFFLANDGHTPNEFRVSWNGNVLYDQTDLPSFGYTQEILSDLLATGSSTALQFGFRNDLGMFHLDDVYIGGAEGVPEPATLLLWCTTIPGLALARRRRLP